jgi:DNA adenine methylase
MPINETRKKEKDALNMSKSPKNNLVQPFVKWVGGKRQLLSEIRKFIPGEISTYFEPFVGGGAVLFDIQPKRAVINDYNSELMNAYKIIKSNFQELINDLKTYVNTEECFYRVREMDRLANFKDLPDVKRASRIIYLNKTCFNGLFRVNNKGQFNASFGNHKEPNFADEPTLKAINDYFNSNDITFLNVDFAESLKGAKKNDFVYLDPPYDPVSDISAFTRYTLKGFDKSEQQRLKETCDILDRKGIKFLLSNSATPYIKNLYKDYTIGVIQANRKINSIADRRGKINEVLIRNF